VATPPLTPLAAAVLRVGRAPERILEVECGDGDGALFLAREFPTARVRGVDRSAERIRAATARVGLDPEGRVAFKVGGPGSLPYPDDFFDLVVTIDGRPRAGEIARVLRPGGCAARLLRRGLRRREIEMAESEQAGDGSFSVGRLRGEDPMAGAE
jgi:ubiquinone/menaquinone biosynthesis C-methylase UbiE